jgi:hypothetical protein
MDLMKADGIISFNKRGNVRDAQSATLAVIQSSAGQRPNISTPVQHYGARILYSRPEYNMLEIGVIEDVEAIVRQAFQKKAALMFKEGEKFAGKNKETINYIKARLQQVEFASGGSWRNLLRETGYALISRSNYFWVKVRNKDASGGRSIGNVAPVAAYFGMGPEDVTFKRDDKGRIVKYRQERNGIIKEWSPRDIIHFYAYKKPGFSFGTPSITPVKDDIRALRRIEENVELLIYQTLFPIFQYKVGTESKPAGDVRLADGTLISEVDYVRGQIENMPAEGGIVTPERHTIEYIGAEKHALKAREYLDYFKQRVISGLGISSVDIGDGDTANRATADSMSRSLVDSVKDYQDILEDFIDKEVIQELLLESTFSYDVLSEENIVKFKFKEVDIEQQMKENVNAQVLYNGNIITVDEARQVAGKEPMSAEDEAGMYHARVTMTSLQAQVDGQIQAASMKADASVGQAKSMSRPTNQYGTKTGPQASRKDYYIKDNVAVDTTRLLRSDILDHVEGRQIDKSWIGVMTGMAKKTITDKYTKITAAAFAQGARDARLSDEQVGKLIITDFPEVRTYTTSYVDKFFKDIAGRVVRTIDKLQAQGRSNKDISKEVAEVIDSIRYRAEFIDRTERIRAYNYGKALALSSLGYKKAGISRDSECETCKDLGYEISLEGFSLDSIPPFHVNSIAKITNGIS